MVRFRSRSSVVLVLAGALAACGGHSNDGAPGGEDAGVDGSFTQAEGGAGEGGAEDGGVTSGLIVEPDMGLTPVYDFIRSAKKTLDMTMYELDDTTVTGLLTTLAKNGVTVRVILDQNLEMSTNTTAYDALGAAGVQVHWANPTYAATHQKTITVDGTTSLIMTLNFASEEYKTSRDFAWFDSDAKDVAAIEATFAADLTNSAISPDTADDLVWSPTNSEGSLVAFIQSAKSTLLVENEEMGDGDIVSALVKAAERGVAVHVTMENSADYASEFTELVGAGVGLVTYQHASLYIHAKVMVADYGTASASAYLGSENFSNASLTENRELGIISRDATLVSGINTTVSSDFKGGTPYAPDAGTGTHPTPDASVDADTDDAEDASDAASPDAGD
jgi:phosphatidylserine/phosphatidylglycerophosphate/cardiolipin synthase-like enzyme